MKTRDNLGDRMKRHESTSDYYLSRRTPVIGRVDGRAFHTLTKGMDKPFDQRFIQLMAVTATELCKQIQGCKMAYVQSDEISLLLTDWDKLDSEAWFDYRLNKMNSIAAVVASNRFNKNDGDIPQGEFDSRFFNLPKEEVCNYFIWRQQDAIRNSIQMLGQSHFTAKQLHGIKAPDLQRKLIEERNVSWNRLPAWCQRGSAVVNNGYGWAVDWETPVFVDDRFYVEKRLQATEHLIYSPIE